MIMKYRPWAIINAAEYHQMDADQQEVEACLFANTSGTVNLAYACKEHNVQLLSFSSDMVFNGSKTIPYLEADPAKP